MFNGQFFVSIVSCFSYGLSNKMLERSGVVVYFLTPEPCADPENFLRGGGGGGGSKLPGGV